MQKEGKTVEIPEIISAESIVSQQLAEKQKLLHFINTNLYGNDEYIDGPFGRHKQVYCDYAASGKPLKCIEDYMEHEVYPVYANTHTTSSFTGIQMSCFREESREIIRDTYHCTNDDIILFTENGCTGAINTFCRIMGLEKAGIPFNSVKKPYPCEFPGCRLCYNDVGDLRLHQRTHTDGDSGFNKISIDTSEGHVVNHNIPIESSNPIIFVGPYEHHSNLLVWRESQADVIVIPERNDSIGGLNIEYLEEMLQKYEKRSLKICSFSLCSNVTGILTSPDPINILAHKYNALICWDCASAGGHLPIYMNSTYLDENNYVDALFFSPHKMVGGPGCPGVLILKKWYFTNEIPHEQGGGTIHYVGQDRHRYTYNLMDKEEAGTPNVIGDIKLGLVLRLHNTLGWEYIESREQHMIQDTIEKWSVNKNIEILGKSASRSAIISILIKHNGYYLHWNYVSMLLSDIFGIQCRSGCMCAGPYSMEILGIDRSHSLQLDHLLLNKNEIIRPGYTRISLSYALSDVELKYIQDAVLFVATYGYILLPEYIYFSETAEWKHISIRNKKPFRRWLNKVNFKDGMMTYPNQDLRDKLDNSSIENPVPLFEDTFKKANQLIRDTLLKIRDKHYAVAEIYTSDDTGKSIDEDIDIFRWYATRYDVYKEIKEHKIENIDTFLTSLDTQSKEFSEETNSNMLIQIHHHNNGNNNNNNNAFNNTIMKEGEDDDDKTYEEIVTELNHDLNKKQKIESQHEIVQSNTLSNESNNEDNEMNGNTKTTNFVVKSSKLTKPLPKCFSSTGREIVPANIAKLRGEEGVEFKYMEGPDGSVEYTAFVRGMPFEERCKYMRTHKDLYPVPSKKIMRLVGQANEHFEMIKEGDRVLLGLSGGKDSLTMLHCLLQLQKRSPYKFHIGCVTVDPQTNGFDPSPLRAYCHKLGVDYYYESRSIIQLAATKLQNNSICSFCSRMKRGVLYGTMRREGYNVLVLAQHLDDLCESFLMSVFHNGLLRTMKANYTVSKGDIRVIRPFIYLREKETREFAKGCELPIIDENCPACFEGPKERYRMKQLLASQENLYSSIYHSILSAIMPLLSIKTASIKFNNQPHETPRMLRGKRHRLEEEEEESNKQNKKMNNQTGNIEDEIDDDDDDF